MHNNKSLFDYLNDNREIIESETKLKYEWNRINNKKASRIRYKIKGLNFDDHSNYNELMTEVINNVIVMRDVFRKYIEMYNMQS